MQTKALRLEVFVEEQCVPEELEIDEFDLTAQHFIVIKHGFIVATLRLILNEKIAKLGRLVVAKAYRHQGIATQLMQQAVQFCQQQDVAKIELGAQITAKDFYKKVGYEEKGNTFIDAGIPHILMVKDIKVP